MAYQHDLFISYRRDPITVDWMCEHFLPFLISYLQDAMWTECKRDLSKIFIDQTGNNVELIKKLADDQRTYISGVDPGADWDTQIRAAIKASRCMLGIWTPGYFQSRWCNIEWKSFEKRT